MFNEVFVGPDRTCGYLLEGRWVASEHGEPLDIVSPIDDSLVGRVQACSTAEADRVVQAAARAWPAWNERSVSERCAILVKASQLIMDHRGALTDALVREIAKTPSDAASEVTRTAELTDYFAQEGRRYYGEVIWGDSFPGYTRDKLCLVYREPMGVILAISPYNYPLNLMASKLAPALITGNAVVMKPATQGSVACALMAELFRQAGVPAGVMGFVTGRGRDIGDPLVSHPMVDMISFTGGTSTGKHLAHTAGIIPLQLEMGGKDAAVVFEDADLDLAVAQILKGAYGYAGQRCTGVKRVVAVGPVADVLAGRLAEGARQLKAGDPRSDDAKVIPPLVDDARADFVQGLIDDALEQGATLLAGNTRRGRYMDATLLDQVTEEMEIAWEEPFGPVLPILRVGGAEEAIALCNRSRYGLQSCVFTRDIDRAFWVGRRLDVGTVNINGADSRGPDHFPFTGAKDSGMGTQGVHYSIEAMTRDRSVVLNLRAPTG